MNSNKGQAARVVPVGAGYITACCSQAGMLGDVTECGERLRSELTTPWTGFCCEQQLELAGCLQDEEFLDYLGSFNVSSCLLH